MKGDGIGHQIFELAMLPFLIVSGRDNYAYIVINEALRNRLLVSTNEQVELLHAAFCNHRGGINRCAPVDSKMENFIQMLKLCFEIHAMDLSSEKTAR